MPDLASVWIVSDVGTCVYHSLVSVKNIGRKEAELLRGDKFEDTHPQT